MDSLTQVESFIQLCCDQTDKELDRNHAYTESNYQNALLHFLLSNQDFRSRYNVMREVHINYKLSDGFVFGHGRADIILDSPKISYILELKANVGSDTRHLRKYIEQCRRYMHNYSFDKPSSKVIGFVVVFNSGCGPIFKKITCSTSRNK